MRLLENRNLFAQTRASEQMAMSVSRHVANVPKRRGCKGRSFMVVRGRGQIGDVRARLLVCEGREVDGLDVHTATKREL